MKNASKLIVIPFIASLAALALATPNKPGATGEHERVGDFALIDHQGGFMHLSRYRYKDALVIFSQANDCNYVDADMPELRQLREQWQSKDVGFFMMNSIADEDRDALIATAESKSLDFPILDDSAQLVAEKLSLSKAGEMVVIDPTAMTINYRGPIHGPVNEVLQKTLAGKADTTVVREAQGCEIEFPAKTMHAQNVPDYAEDVAPIIEENCAYCHREGGIGPFAMNNYMMVKGYSPMIREVVLTKRMPPMQVDPHYRKATNANYMSDDELQTLVHWIDAGAPRGDSANDPLTQIAHVDMRAWQLGEPDYVVTAPKHDVPATGVLDYINTTVQLEFDEDKWVKAVQFIPGDPAVLHHMLSYVVPPTENFIPGQEVSGDFGEAAPPSNRDDDGVASGLNSRKFLEGYAPGKVDAMTFPENTGIFIPKGHRLAMQFHYTTNGKATSDQTLAGLYFYDEDNLPEHEYENTAVATMFTIPPNAVEHKAAATHVFKDKVVVYGLRAHMHFRGKYMKFAVEYPDGKKETLLSVPNYSYNWQPTYQLEEPVTLPAGTKVHVTGAWDNSKYNPANPDPSKELTFGLQSWDEMFIGYWSYYRVEDDQVATAE